MRPYYAKIIPKVLKQHHQILEKLILNVVYTALLLMNYVTD